MALTKRQKEVLNYLVGFLNKNGYSPSFEEIAHALKLPRISVVRRLEEMIKHGYVERVGNAYRVTDKVNIPELQSKLQAECDCSLHPDRRPKATERLTMPLRVLPMDSLRLPALSRLANAYSLGLRIGFLDDLPAGASNASGM